MNKHRLVFFLVACALFLTCSRRQNPYTDPDNAAVNETRLPAVSTALDMYASHQCSVEVFLPEFVDTFMVVVRQPGFIDTIALVDSVSENNP